MPLTSKTGFLLDGEFVLAEWATAGLNIATAVKRGIYTVNRSLVIKTIGKLGDVDIERLEQSLRIWLVVCQAKNCEIEGKLRGY